MFPDYIEDTDRALPENPWQNELDFEDFIFSVEADMQQQALGKQSLCDACGDTYPDEELSAWAPLEHKIIRWGNFAQLVKAIKHGSWFCPDCIEKSKEVI